MSSRRVGRRPGGGGPCAPGGGAAARPGLTLIEIVLAITLVVMLATLVTVTVGRGHERREFEEGVGRIETLLRAARSQARLEKRRVQLLFDPPVEGEPVARILWEPNPLTEPGTFVDLDSAYWRSLLPTEGVRVLGCRLVGPSALRPRMETGEDADPERTPLQDVLFYPRGPSDSALIEVAPADESDALRAAIRLDGPTGAVRTWILTASQLEDNAAEIEQGLYEPEDSG